MIDSPVTALLLKTNPKGPDSHPLSETVEQETEKESWYVCRNCRQKLTQPSHRTAIQGSHIHTFANPSGIVFEIACFNYAQGYSFLGPPSIEFAWFAGHSWRIVICAACLVHVGWLFASQNGTVFFGLITDRVSIST